MLKNYKVTVNGKTYDVQVEELNAQNSAPQVAQPTVTPAQPTVATHTPQPQKTDAPVAPVASPANGVNVEAPMPGKILKIKVEKGDTVTEGQQVLVLEAMKMENEIFTTTSGKVAKICVKEGDNVATGDVLMVIA
ncbi:MAG: biotin/lipoyl-containing protein [Synergistaceae bacterium]|nr:biotin/lipoyl-containing protein [Synergistaceae bacterium]